MLNLVLSLSLSHTGHWKFNMVLHGKELSEDLKIIIVALHKDGVGQWFPTFFSWAPPLCTHGNLSPTPQIIFIHAHIYIYIYAIIIYFLSLINAHLTLSRQ